MNTFWITNVRLEKGFKYDNDRITGTETEICHLKIEHGKITEITDLLPNSDEKQIDAKNQLLLPSLRDMHIHIDKTYYGGPWKACTPITNGIFTRLEEEKELLPKLLPTAQERAEKMIESARKETDEQKRLKLYEEVMQKEIDDAVYVPIRNYEHLAAYSKNVSGFWLNAANYLMIDDVVIK